MREKEKNKAKMRNGKRGLWSVYAVAQVCVQREVVVMKSQGGLQGGKGYF